jgi:hypothetical protein
MKQIKKSERIRLLKKVVNGDLINRLTRKTGKEMGDLINKTIKWMMDNNITSTDKKKIQKFIEEN